MNSWCYNYNAYHLQKVLITKELINFWGLWPTDNINAYAWIGNNSVNYT